MKKLTLIFFTILSVAYFALSASLIKNDPILSYDDKLLLSPLLENSSVTGYFKALEESRIVDRQPLRDLSYLMDIALKKHFPLWSFHLTNIIIGLLSLFIFFRLAQFYLKDKFLLIGTTVLLAFHPSLWLTLSWISGRKHLLSFFFILLATLAIHVFKRKRNSNFLLLSIISFFFALLSHPIAIFWAIWTFYFLKDENKVVKFQFTFPAILLSLIVAWTNFHYYQGIYLKQGASVKIISGYSFAESILALGRYSYNALLPFQISPSYYPGSPANLLGLVLLLSLIFLIRRFVSKDQMYLWIGFAAFPLVTVLGTQQNVFVHDSYSLISLAGLWIIFAQLIVNLPLGKKAVLPILNILALLFLIQSYGIVKSFESEKKLWERAWETEETPFVLAQKANLELGKKAVLPILNILALLFLIQSYGIVKSFESENKLWERAWETEETPFVLAQKANLELERNEYLLAMQDIERLKSWSPNHPLLPILYPKIVYLSPQLTFESKKNKLESNYQGEAWQAYFLSALHAQNNDFLNAFKLLKDQVSKCVEFENEAEIVAAELKYFCIKSKGPECNKLVQDFSSACQFRALTWHEEIVQKRLSELLR